MTISLGQKLQVKPNFLENNCSAIAIYGSGQGDDDSVYACINGTESILYLRQHATTDGAIGLVLLEIGAGDGGDNRIVVVGIAQYALDRKSVV